MTLLEAKYKQKPYLVGNYRFTGRLLGKGNFARVEEAVHTMLSVKVAIKIMDINEIKEEYVIRNLGREAKLMAKLSHPCICALYQTMKRSDNVYYLVSELANGGDLCTFVKEQRGGRLEERPARIYARQFVSALAHMHSVGVVHRDLKMENVMLNTARTQIKIVDFGLSNIYNHSDPLKTHCGSPEYAAPELFVTGMTYGPEVDVWSLGIIFYGMVVGQLPFVCNKNEPISSQERRKKLVAQINKGLGVNHKKSLLPLSPDFRNMIGRMLVGEIDKRISVKELLSHPFITEKGTRAIRVHPIKKLDLRHQASIIAEICEMIHLSSDLVIKSIKEEPFSKISGMYNILAHRLILNRLSGDGITKVRPVLEPSSKESLTVRAKSPQTPPAKRLYQTKSASRSNTREPILIVQDKTLTPKNESRPMTVLENSSKHPTVSQNSIRPKMNDIKRPTSPVGTMRPKTVQYSKKSGNYKDFVIKSPSSMTRNTTIPASKPKSIRPSTVASPLSNKSNTGKNSRVLKDVQKKLASQTTDDTKKPTEKVEHKKSLLMLPHSLKLALKREERVSSSPEKKQRSNKSEKLPVTTGNWKSPTTTQSDSKATRPQTSPFKEYKPLTRFLRFARPGTSGQAMEKCPMAYGDIAQKNQATILSNQKTKKPTIYDPIARSIAGYVCNNVPNRLKTKLTGCKE
ncbi:serine/threonine-protein kinase MARK2-like [Anthonomus grandis grandis]|uniref:serine/threonine-protein kinase MARK2-like n=1 Tax=Anthonomus grandis grandis TaxID=2921223 RepID=UPI002164F601|nr:serine/threonine-protein kinase MARK2-like [Anthonomus grandis grandis]